MQIQITISKEDAIHNDIITSVIGVEQRKAFVKEAIYYWDYILHHTDRISSYIRLKSEEILFPPLYIDNSNIKKFNSRIYKGNIERAPISVRINIAEDDTVLKEIIGRVLVKPDFIKEAIYNWYYAIHNSHLSSYYINLIPGFKKKTYLPLELESILSETQIREIYSLKGNSQLIALASSILNSLGNSVDVATINSQSYKSEVVDSPLEEVAVTITAGNVDDEFNHNDDTESSTGYGSSQETTISSYEEYEEEQETESIFDDEDDEHEYEDYGDSLDTGDDPF